MSAAIWSSPDSPFFQPLPGYSLGGVNIPDMNIGYSGGKVKKIGQPLPKTDFAKLPFPVVGTDFSTGQRDVDLQAGSGASVPSLSPALSEISKALAVLGPYQEQQQIRQAYLQDWLTGRQIGQLYPVLSQAGQEATARSLAASQAMAAFKQGLPTTAQDIMASKQQQLASAASAEAQRGLAMAAQQEAAKKAVGQYTGKYVSFG